MKTKRKARKAKPAAKRYRSAITGRFVSAKTAKRRPRTTVGERR